VRYFLWTTATRRDANGALVEILVVGHDITRRREAEEARLALERKMLEAQRLESLGVLAGGIAHDFNNMLAAIIGNASLLLLDLTPGTEPYQSAREIDLVGHRAAELVAQMLAYAGQGSFTVQTFSLNELVAEMLVLLRTSISKGTTLMQRLGPGLPSISGDLAQVRQVVMNLIVNASEALDQRDGLVTISTALYQIDAATAATFTLTPGIAPGRYIGLTIEDTGIGMDPGIVGRIFEPFFTTKFTGRGLGLAAVLGIMRAHGGGLSVASALGLGSRFTALFPVAAGEFPVAFHHEPAVFLTRAEGEPSYTPVLLIDDEADVRRATARLLERAGYTPLLAADGQHGLVIAADPQQPIAVALIDLTMPGLNGEQLFRELRRLRPTLPVAVISGYASDAITHRFVAEQPDAFLQKPFSAASLLELVGRLAQRSQS
jgi:signal transduction histidine kinase/ActR/RegA family two-component response regulator